MKTARRSSKIEICRAKPAGMNNGDESKMHTHSMGGGVVEGGRIGVIPHGRMTHIFSPWRVKAEGGAAD